MGDLAIQQINIFPLKRITMSWGDVLHAYKSGDQGLNNFGEVYFSWVKIGSVRDWKCHKRMTMNLVVPVGNVRFAFIEGDLSNSEYRLEEIGVDRYARLRVAPGIWFSFRSVGSSDGLLVNFADMAHDQTEVLRKPLSTRNIDWGAD
jgi:dTDP-4-dehydrorhamnose 3,5-epimerase